MKKVVIAAIALSLFSTTAFAGAGKEKAKKAKAKTGCTKICVPTKDCKKSTTCPIMPGCVCI
jgi:hypothetical protein